LQKAPDHFQWDFFSKGTSFQELNRLKQKSYLTSHLKFNFAIFLTLDFPDGIHHLRRTAAPECTRVLRVFCSATHSQSR